jgi:hypothetical protein
MVRIKIKLSSLKAASSLEVNSLLNTGFGTEEPEVLIPVKVAEKLSLWPQLPEGAVIRPYETAGGITRMCHLVKAIEIYGITEDKTSKAIKCNLVISEIEQEVLLSDTAISELGIVIEDAGKGLWRFKNEVKVRTSVEPQYW